MAWVDNVFHGESLIVLGNRAPAVFDLEGTEHSVARDGSTGLVDSRPRLRRVTVTPQVEQDCGRSAIALT